MSNSQTDLLQARAHQHRSSHQQQPHTNVPHDRPSQHQQWRQVPQAHLQHHQQQQQAPPFQRHHLHPSNSREELSEGRKLQTSSLVSVRGEGTLKTEQERKEQQPPRQLQRQSQRSWPPIEMERGEFPPLANTMNVDSIVIHCGAKNTAKESPGAPTTNNIIDLVTSICTTWKRQVDALALAPVEQLDFYRRQFDQLVNVLSISLFSKTASGVTPPTSGAVKRSKEEPDKTSQKKQTRKRNATPSSDYDLIIFEDGENRYLYRRVESADKYAKRKKIPKYIRITTKRNEETKDLVACLRAIDRKFVVGKEIRFDEKRSLSDLYGEMKKRISDMSLEHEPIIDFVEDAAAEMGVDQDVDHEVYQGPPAKQRKVEQAKGSPDQVTLSPPSRNDKRKPASLKNGECKTRPSGVEMQTDSEIDEDEEEETNDEEGKKKRSESDDDQSDDDGSSSDSDSSDEEDEERGAKLALAMASCDSDPYVPTGQPDTPSVSNYVPTPLNTDKPCTDADVNRNTSPELLPNVTSKKKKRRDREYDHQL